MQENVSFTEIGQAVEAHHSFAVVSHVRPDGDAIGSILALGHALEQLGKSVRYLNNDGCPESLAFLPGSDKVERSGEAGEVDVEVAICLDTATHQRIGPDSLKATRGAGLLINIDHHVSNEAYGDLNYIDSHSPATGQIVYELLRALNWPISGVSRDAIYVAVSTDTGSFRYPATTQKTYEMAADLVALGLDVGEINQLTYNNYPYRRVELMKALLDTLGQSEDHRLVWWDLRLDTKKELLLGDDDSEGMIDFIRSVRGVVVAVFFEELENGMIRVSMRSKDRRVHANEICANFGGGGHALAAGIRMPGPLEEAREKVLAEIGKTMARNGL